MVSRPVSRVLYGPRTRRSANVAAIHLGRSSPTASCNQPGRRAGKSSATRRSAPLVVPIRFCSRWGLPCRPRYRVRGALLPHPFTLATACDGGLLSVALSLGSPPPDVIRHRLSMEPGLSSPAMQERPPGRLTGSGCGAAAPVTSSKKRHRPESGAGDHGGRAARHRRAAPAQYRIYGTYAGTYPCEAGFIRCELALQMM